MCKESGAVRLPVTRTPPIGFLYKWPRHHLFTLFSMFSSILFIIIYLLFSAYPTTIVPWSKQVDGLEISPQLAEEFAPTGDGDYESVDAFRVKLYSNAQGGDVFYVKVVLDADSESVSLQYLDSKTGNIKSMTANVFYYTDIE